MATASTASVTPLPGNLVFSDGGMSVNYLVGAFIKSATFADGIWTLTFQNASGVEETGTLPAGWIPSATELTDPYKGLGWYDTTANTLKIYNGTSFVPLTGGSGGSGEDTTAARCCSY